MSRRIASVAAQASLIGLASALAQMANAQAQLVAPSAPIRSTNAAAPATGNAPDPLVTPPSSAWWASAEALVWDVRSAPLPPTLTTFAPGTPSATTGFGGQLGVPGTSVLSPDHIGYGMAPGARFSLGHWLDTNPKWGIEGEGFFLDSRTASFSASSSGTPPLRVPFTNVPPGDGFPLGPSSFVLADPGFAAGSQVIDSSLQFWGAEGNGLYRALDAGPYHVSLLAGVRYLDLREGLSITSNEAVPTEGSYSAFDKFETRNQFIGGQVGVKANAQFGQFDGSLLAKVALGDINQTVIANGSSVVTGFGGPSTPTTTPGGLFTQTTNIGQQNRNAFSAVPEARFELGYWLLPGIRLSAGYDFIYLGNVVRPGNEIDTTLNLTTNPAISGPGVAAMGAARPEPLSTRSSFWAQGVTVHLTYRF
jgi:hypothetical protein